VDVAGSKLTVDKRGLEVAEGQEVNLSIRSECVAMAEDTSAGAEGAGLTGAYDEAVYLGLTTSHRVRLPDGTEMVSRVIADTDHAMPAAGAPVRLHWKPSDIRLHVE
jgi:hypothetical protein